MSSGGSCASGRYVKDDRRLEIHFRQSLGLVTYHLGKIAITHEQFMYALLGPQGGNKYPNFSDDPLEAFRDLSWDLERYCLDFLTGPGEEFARCVQTAKEHANRTGFARMTDFES